VDDELAKIRMYAQRNETRKNDYKDRIRKAEELLSAPPGQIESGIRQKQEEGVSAEVM
jgi:hypothetical protein